MSDTRQRNGTWTVCGDDGRVTWDGAQLAVLMDIRDELQKLNRVFACPNFVEVPNILRTIEANTRKPKPKRKRKAAKK